MPATIVIPKNLANLHTLLFNKNLYNRNFSLKLGGDSNFIKRSKFAHVSKKNINLKCKNINFYIHLLTWVKLVFYSLKSKH